MRYACIFVACSQMCFESEFPSYSHMSWQTSQSTLGACKLDYFHTKPNCRMCLRSTSNIFQLLKGVQSPRLGLASPCNSHSVGTSSQHWLLIFVPTPAALNYCYADRARVPQGMSVLSSWHALQTWLSDTIPILHRERVQLAPCIYGWYFPRCLLILHTS